jgi:tRNA(Ile)-lysidine synthase TilS/MesJ
MIPPIDLDKKYGIMLSGGLDSAVLLYLLIRQEPKIQLQPFTIDKTDGASCYANPIVKHFNKKFNLSIPETIYVGDSRAHHRVQSTTAVIDIFNNYLVNRLFIGINQNPPELDHLPGAPQRDKKSNDPRIIFPFVDLYKTDIIEMMFKHNQQDLIYITHSCTEQSIGRCNRCWQCTERSWSFSKLGQEDNGLL